MIALSIKNLRVTRKGRHGGDIVSGFDLELAEGKFHFLLGPNGCGKSTTLSAVMHLLDMGTYGVSGRIAAGRTVLWNGEGPAMEADALRDFLLQRIGYIPQDPQSSLEQIVPVGYGLAEKEERLVRLGVTPKESPERLLSRLLHGREDPQRFLSQRPSQLSGGQKQMASIALSLLGDPRLILADEGFDFLDLERKEHVLGTIIERVTDPPSRTTVLAVCHDYQIVLQVRKLLRERVKRPDEYIELHDDLSPGHVRRMERAFVRNFRCLKDRLESGEQGEATCETALSILPGTYRFENAFNGFELSVKEEILLPRGALVAVLGKSGSGKTTLARLVCGILPTKSFRVAGLPGGRTDVQYTYQVPYVCFNDCMGSPWYLVEEGRTVFPFREADSLFRCLEWGEWLERREEAASNGTVFSGGELQKICLARAMLWRPEVIFLDEPFNNLDPESHQGFVELVYEREQAVRFLILHDPLLALSLASHIIFIQRGEVVLASEVGAILSRLRADTLDDLPLEVSSLLRTVRRTIDWLDREIEGTP